MDNKKLKSIKNYIDDQLILDVTECDTKHTQIWLEGWICGVTDSIIHPKFSELKEECFDYLMDKIDNKLFAITKEGGESKMKVSNVTEIFDNGEFVTLVLSTGSAVHLPEDSKHSIVVKKIDDNADVLSKCFDVVVDLYEG